MATLTRQKARKDYACGNCGAGIDKGEEYFRFKPTRFSPVKIRCTLCKPRRSEMTQSEFLAAIYDIEDQIEALTIDDMDDPEAAIESIKSDLEILRDETDDKLNNMPDSLISSPTGELLQSRVDSVQEMLDELDNLDIDFEDLDPDELSEKKEEILEAIQSISYCGE